ncbi:MULTISPECIES: Csu type fimbrial protein [unclassified Luteimonas]
MSLTPGRLVRALAFPALCVLLAFAPRIAQAQQCWIHGDFWMDFGSITPAGAKSSTYVTYRCQAPYARRYYFRMCLFIGPGSQGRINPRRMTNYNGSYLAYDLYSDPGRQAILGGVATAPAYQLQLEVAANSISEGHAPIYGQVHPGQSVPAFAEFQETGLPGSLVFLASPTAVPETVDCRGGTTVGFNTREVEARFENRCSFTASDLDFGQVETLGGLAQESASLRVDCPAGTHWSLGLGNGRHYAGGTRRMEGGGDYVVYQLYRDPARSQAWGNTGPGDRLAGSTDAAGNTVTVTVYGRVPAQADVRPGRYADTVIATLYY